MFFLQGVLYISTEDVFPSRRLNELVENLPEYLKSCGDINYKENIYLEHSTDFVGCKYHYFHIVRKLVLGAITSMSLHATASFPC